MKEKNKKKWRKKSEILKKKFEEKKIKNFKEKNEKFWRKKIRKLKKKKSEISKKKNTKFE